MRGLVAEAFQKVSSEHKDRVAIYALSERLTPTFAELANDAHVLHRALEALRLPPNPTIVSNVGNRTSFVPLFVAGLGCGSGFLPLDGGASPREVFDLADSCSADLIVIPARPDGPEAWRDVVSDWLPCGLAAIRRMPADGPSWRQGETDALVLRVTSGSTGFSKIAVMREQSLVNDGRHVIEAMGISSHDISAATVPMAHAYGMGNLLLPLILEGSPIAMRDRFVYAQWASDVTELGVTMFPGVPFIFDHLRRADAAAAPLSRLRLVVTAGAPIDFETLRYFKDRFGVKIHSLYGTTETGSITFDSSDALSDRVTVGWPMPETTVVLSETDDVRSGGRVLVRGSAVSRGYAFNEAVDESAPVFTPDGFLTGDLGRLADDGQLVLVGRVSAFVNVAGRKVSPGEIERVIAELPDVSQVWVLGVTDGARGQELVACVSRRNGSLSAAAVRTHCAAILSPYKVPKRIVFADELPVTSRGKVTRQTVEALLKSRENSREHL
jgi:acyl-CoA synthetase (AMP-forming)/AMP-acid ligase II